MSAAAPAFRAVTAEVLIATRDPHGPVVFDAIRELGVELRAGSRGCVVRRRHRSFFFRGPDLRHNVRAQNLAVFCQMAEGIDVDVPAAKRRPFALFRDAVKDNYLADQISASTFPRSRLAISFASSSLRVTHCPNECSRGDLR